jgi:HEAT repeat protein
VLELAARDPDGMVRGAALRAMVRLGAGTAVRVATAKLADPYLGARLAAVAVLAAARDQPGLAAALASPDPFVVLRAAVALKRADAVTASLAHTDWTVRVAAINALEALGLSQQATRLLADASWQVELAAARAVYAGGAHDRALAVLAAVAAQDGEDEALEAAIDLRRFGAAGAAAVFTRLLADPDAGVRARAATALRGPGDLPEGVVALLADPAWKVRIAAAWTLLVHLDA